LFEVEKWKNIHESYNKLKSITTTLHNLKKLFTEGIVLMVLTSKQNLIFCIILLLFCHIFVVSKPKPTPNATSTAAHPALMHPLAAGRKYRTKNLTEAFSTKTYKKTYKARYSLYKARTNKLL
jgi:hypothetical protein